MDTGTRWILIISALLLAVLGGFVLFTSPSDKPATVDVSKVNTSGSPFIGNTDAPVTIAYWSDYQCPACKMFDGSTISQLAANEVASGKLKIVFKDYSFLGPDSTTAAIAARAVWELAPEKFYDWHRAMFAAQGDENSGWASKDKILVITKTLGIDADKIGEMMTSKANDYQKSIDADYTEGTAFGLQGTPAVIVGNGNALINRVVDYAALQALVNAELNK